MLTIMRKNQPLCDFDLRTGLVHIIHQLPLDLYVEESDDIDTRINNLSNLYHWCASRVLSLDRKYAKEILNSCHLLQARTDKDRAMIALKYKCLSLQDSYWVRGNVNEQWTDLNLFNNTLSNAFVDVSLMGKSMTINNEMLLAPDCSTDGVAPKAWVRTDKGLFLYKASANGSDSVTKEVEASHILQKLGFSVLNYDYASYENVPVSSSKCFTSTEISSISAEKYSYNYNLEPLVNQDFYIMNLCDYLVGNTDRHWGNWLFLYDDTGITGYAPLMDFNHAFEANDDTSCLPYGYVYNESISQYTAARIALEKTDIHLPDINLSEFKYGPYTMKRIQKLLDGSNSHIL